MPEYAQKVYSLPKEFAKMVIVKFLVSRFLTVNLKTSWSEFFTSLKRRDLENVDLVVSDNHKGLVKAVGKCFQNTSWQRCQTHFSKNVLDKNTEKIAVEAERAIKSHV